MKKLTYEFVKEQFEKEGYELLSKEYINANSKLEYVCPDGHHGSMRFGSFNYGYRCNKCGYKNSIDKRRIDITYIDECFKNIGYTLLTKKYINNKQRLDFICSIGHKHNIAWSDFKNGHRCALCAGNVKLNYSFIKDSFEQEGYTLLSTEYSGNNQKLEFVCPKGHQHSMIWGSWQRGRRCYWCGLESTIDQKRLSISIIKESFENDGFKLLTTKYVNNNQKLEYICPNGHINTMTWAGWKKGNRCAICAGVYKHDYEFIRKSFDECGYRLLTTEYINSKQKMEYECPVGHKHSIIWNSWQQGTRCPICADINMSGPNNPGWKGGISFEPYCSIWKDAEYKEYIKERDGYKCLNPYCFNKDTDLNIHHIDYNKKNCIPKNLITLCRSCNARANKNRDWHTEFYQTIMNDRYNYNY